MVIVSRDLMEPTSSTGALLLMGRNSLFSHFFAFSNARVSWNENVVLTCSIIEIIQRHTVNIFAFRTYIGRAVKPTDSRRDCRVLFD
jgi:hypothetical protein